MLNATVTPCCQRRVHRQCYQTHVHSSNTCGHCREPFTVHEAQAMATVANPEPEHPFRKADMELCKQQRQQAIRDLEAVTTRSSRSKDWTGMFKSSNFSRSSVLKPWSKTNHFFIFQLSRFFSPAGYWMQSIHIFECSNIQFWDTCKYPMHTMLSVLQEPMQQEEFPIIYYSRYCHRELSHLLHFYYFHFL